MQNEHIDHYTIMRRAIEIIDTSKGNLSTDDLSAKIGISTPQFQNIFSQWVGMTPQYYREYLTLDHAKFLLENRFKSLSKVKSICPSDRLEASDIQIQWHTISSVEYANLTIHWGWFNSPFGDILVMGSKYGLCSLAFTSEIGRRAAFQDMINRWPKARYSDEKSPLWDWVQTWLNQSGTIALAPIGTPWQLNVWETLLRIPSGYVTTYSEIANHLNTPKASRAVGTSIGQNPIGWIIPCHRVLRKSGELGGYHWGIPLKRALLAYESAQANTRLK